MKEPEFIPKDGELCRKCKFFYDCPLDYFCETWIRTSHEEYDDIRNGDSA